MLLELVLATSHCALPGPSEVVGLWELPPGSSGIGRAIELRADGNFIETMTVMVDMNYRLSAEGLTILNGATTDAKSLETIPFKVTAGNLSYRHRRHGRVRMVRVGPPPDPKNLILGVWRYRHYTGGTAFEKYVPDGRLLFRLPFPGPKKGCFSVEQAVVSLTYPNGPVVLRQTASDVLRQEGDESDAAFERAVGGVWYPLTVNDEH